MVAITSIFLIFLFVMQSFRIRGQILSKTGRMIHERLRHLRNKRKKSMKELKQGAWLENIKTRERIRVLKEEIKRIKQVELLKIEETREK